MADARIPVPEGMTAEAFQKIVATFLKSRETGKVKGTAQAKAMKDLKAAHKAEYDGLVTKYSPK